MRAEDMCWLSTRLIGGKEEAAYSTRASPSSWAASQNGPDNEVQRRSMATNCQLPADRTLSLAGPRVRLVHKRAAGGGGSISSACSGAALPPDRCQKSSGCKLPLQMS